MKQILATIILLLFSVTYAMADVVIRNVGEWKCEKEYDDLYLYYRGEDVKEIKVPEVIQWSEKEAVKVTHLGKNAFRNLSNLQVVTIPDNLKRICNGAFFNCPNLAKMNLNCKVEVSDKSFEGTPDLSSTSRPLYCQPILRYVGEDGNVFDYPYNSPINRADLPFVKVVSLDPDMTVFRLTISAYDCMDCEVYCDGDTLNEPAIQSIARRKNGRQIYIRVELKDRKGNSIYPRFIPFTLN